MRQLSDFRIPFQSAMGSRKPVSTANTAVVISVSICHG